MAQRHLSLEIERIINLLIDVCYVETVSFYCLEIVKSKAPLWNSAQWGTMLVNPR